MHCVNVLLRQIRYLLDLFAILIGLIFYPSKQRYLPPIKNSLLVEPATKLSSKIKSGKVN